MLYKSDEKEKPERDYFWLAFSSAFFVLGMMGLSNHADWFLGDVFCVFQFFLISFFFFKRDYKKRRSIRLSN